MLLWKEMLTPKKFPIRLIYLFYERDNFNPDSICGIRWMMGHVKIMPDNKVVEDCHNDIRRCANSNPNPVLSTGIAVVSSANIHSRDTYLHIPCVSCFKSMQVC
jgi:hypothetical protein